MIELSYCCCFSLIFGRTRYCFTQNIEIILLVDSRINDLIEDRIATVDICYNNKQFNPLEDQIETAMFCFVTQPLQSVIMEYNMIY